ncbi:hypothetical protein PVK06_030482 [Gossypium arboreum]|uniref:Uncharacterized protein n=1 Tax=Gossypium arboreum TaxID=29729 RepID=A0ABR0NPG9_GOSAR|nr:hypothetical protein PVK06_030482 [Gossypium arboreum]
MVSSFSSHLSSRPPPPLVFARSDLYTMSDRVDTSTASQIAPSPGNEAYTYAYNYVSHSVVLIHWLSYFVCFLIVGMQRWFKWLKWFMALVVNCFHILKELGKLNVHVVK